MITCITPTIEGREDLLAECKESVRAAGFQHLVGLDERREGPAAVRNRLLEQVRTPWVLFLDDDDLVYPQYLDIVQRHLREVDVLYTAWDTVGHIEPRPLPGGFNGELLAYQNFIPVTACVRTTALRQVGGFDRLARYEDHDLWQRMYAAGMRFKYIPIIAWVYRRTAGSRTDEHKEVKQ